MNSVAIVGKRFLKKVFGVSCRIMKEKGKFFKCLKAGGITYELCVNKWQAIL